MAPGGRLSPVFVVVMLFALSTPTLTVHAQDARPVNSGWDYGGMVDLSYIQNFNVPDNHEWRSKESTPRTNELTPNMGILYVRKEALPQSRWGMEVAVQGGYDTDALVPQPQAGRDQPISGADALRHLARANVDYLAPIGNGLLLTAGLFKGYINYESFYAKHNFNYTRAYITDYSPNFMMGVGGRYLMRPDLDLGLYVINGYQHLSHPNNLPSYGAEMEWRAAKRLSVTQNVYYGPDQSATDLQYWRFFSDTNIEWKGQDVTFALSYDIGTEKAADLAGSPRTFWTGAALFTRWEIEGPWSVAVRPEIYWDRNGRLTNAEQFIKAITTTAEYKRHSGPQLWIVRLEHRFDESTGADGGFFRRSQVAERGVTLAREQHLLLLSLIWAFDS